MLSYSARSEASPEAAWKLISQPALWHRWAPHLRGAWGLGSPEVGESRIGAALIGGLIPAPVLVRAKQPGRSWSWQSGLVGVEHAVAPTEAGCRVTISLTAPWPLETLLSVSYGPLVGLLVKRLARVAEADGRSAA